MHARNGPPIDDREAVLVSKKLVPEDDADDEDVSSFIPV